MKGLHWTALILTVIGAINWGLVGFFQFDLVAAIFGGPFELASRVVYSIVGIAGLIVLATSAALTSDDARYHGTAHTRMPMR